MLEYQFPASIAWLCNRFAIFDAVSLYMIRQTFHA